MITYQHPTLDVKLLITDNGTVSFTVDGTCDMKEEKTKPEKLAITRWLLKTWKEEIVPTASFLSCQAYNGDEKMAYRESVYSKLGFYYIESSATNTTSSSMYWGNPRAPKTQEDYDEDYDSYEDYEDSRHISLHLHPQELEDGFQYWTVIVSEPEEGWERPESI